MKYLAPTFVILGLVGGLASIFGLQEPLRTVFLLTFVGVFAAGILAAVAPYMGLTALWRVLPASRRFGIVGVYGPTVTEQRLSRRLRAAADIAVMAVSAQHLTKRYKEEIVHALATNRARIRVLLAAPGSAFLDDVERMEGETRVGHIGPEVLQTEALLVEYLREARQRVGTTGLIGSAELGYYSTELRASLVLCDRAWGQLTLNLPPKRAVSTASFEIQWAHDGLLRDSVSHFDRAWTRAVAGGRVRTLSPE